MLPDHDHRYLFIAGLHRSGTSVLHESLKLHPQISGFTDTGVPEDEGQHLQSVMGSDTPYGGPGVFCFSPDAALTESSPLVSDDNRRRLMESWGTHWDFEKPVLTEKSPTNIIRMRFLQAMFPNSYFVLVLRHPVAVSGASQSRWLKMLSSGRRYDRYVYKTGRYFMGSLLRHWLTAHRIARSDVAGLERVHILHYESFVEQPQEHLDAIFRFVGLPEAPIAHTIRPRMSQKYYDKWRLNSRKPKFKRFVTKYEEEMNTFGYSLSDVYHLDPTVFTTPIG